MRALARLEICRCLDLLDRDIEFFIDPGTPSPEAQFSWRVRPRF